MKKYKPHQVRVFVSSTFQDMQAERDVLIKKIAPQLRDICEQRNIFLSFVDLRWGITEQECETNQVISICLDEIEKCQPFFICLLGTRYGWVPKSIPNEVLTKHPWATEFSGRSVTELEIQCGAIQHTDPKGVLFYFKDQTVKGTDDQLVQLKARISSAPFPVKEYSDPEEFGSLLLSDMQALLDELFPVAEHVDPYEIQMFEHQLLASQLSQVYIPNQTYFDAFDDHLKSNTKPLVVTGKPGTGKSALLANWSRRWYQSDGPGLLITYYIGAFAESTDWKTMVLQLIRGMKEGLNIPHPLPQPGGNLKAAFAEWMHLANSYGGLTLVIDGLDQLADKDNAPDLLWLPSLIPEKICLIMSSRPGRSLQEVKQRDWTVSQLEGLSLSERRRFAIEFLQVYRKRLSQSQLSMIERAENASSPIFLRTLLEELRIFGQYDHLTQRIKNYLAAKDTKSLYTKIIKRYEQDYESTRAGLVRDSLTALWAARRGLSESELLEILGREDNNIPNAIWSPFLLSLEANLSNKGGLYSFANQAFREAVELLFLPDLGQQKAAHIKLANLFEGNTSLNRKVDELAWQLSEAKEYERLAIVLSDLELLQQAVENDFSKVVSYWDEIEKHTDQTLIKAFRRVIEAPEDHLDHLYDISMLLMNTLEENGATWHGNTGKHWTAVKMLQAAQEHCAQTGKSGLEVKFLDYEYKVRYNFRLHFKEFKTAHLASFTKDNLLQKIRLLRQLDKPDELFQALIQYHQNRIEYSTGFQGQKAISIFSEGLPYLQDAEKVARDSNNHFKRVRALVFQSYYYEDMGRSKTAYHFADLGFNAAVASKDKDALIEALTRRGELMLLFGEQQKAKKCFDTCLDLLRQVGTLSTLASRITSISTCYVMYSGDAVGFERGLSLRDEARRLYKIMGDWNPLLNPARDDVLKIQLKQLPPSGNPINDFAYQKITNDSGPMWGWWSVPSEKIKECKTNLNACYKVLAKSDSVIETMDFEFTQALLYFLRSLSRDLPDNANHWYQVFIKQMGKAGYTTETLEKLDASTLTTLLADTIETIILGINPLNQELDQANLYYKYNSIENEASWLMSMVLGLGPGFREAYHARAFDEKNIYPGGWEEWGVEGMGILWKKFEHLIEFFLRAKEAGATVVCGPSGSDLEKLDTLRMPAGLEQGQPNYQWFAGKSGGDREVDGTCRNCGYEFSFNPYDGERPPNSCPSCDSVG